MIVVWCRKEIPPHTSLGSRFLGDSVRHKQVPQSTNSGTCDTQLGLNGMVRYMIRVTVRSESGPGSGRTVQVPAAPRRRQGLRVLAHCQSPSHGVTELLSAARLSPSRLGDSRWLCRAGQVLIQIHTHFIPRFIHFLSWAQKSRSSSKIDDDSTRSTAAAAAAGRSGALAVAESMWYETFVISARYSMHENITSSCGVKLSSVWVLCADRDCDISRTFFANISGSPSPCWAPGRKLLWRATNQLGKLKPGFGQEVLGPDSEGPGPGPPWPPPAARPFNSKTPSPKI